MPSIEDLLRARYPQKTHALMFEVRNAAGFSATRSCDAIAVGLWPSRGLELTGFEIKRSRTDWQREYREPEKADAFTAFCDAWYVVASDDKIVQMDELPERWGLLVATSRENLKCVKAAPKLTPEPLSRGMLATLLKRAIEQERGPIKAARDEGFAAGQKYQRELEERRRKDGLDELSTLRKKVDDFERASGIAMYWERDGAKIGDAVRVVLNGGHKEYAGRLKRLLDEVQGLTHMLDGAVRAVAE